MQQQCPNKLSSEILFENIWQIYAASLKSNIMIKIILINLLIRDPSEWPVGPGQLTARGKRMHYHLGQVATYPLLPTDQQILGPEILIKLIWC